LKLKLFTLFTTIALCFSMFVASKPASASTACPLDGWSGTNVVDNITNSPTGFFSKGTVILIFFQLGTPGTQAFGDVWVNNVFFAKQVPVPAVISYTIPADGNYDFETGNNPFLKGNGPINFVLHCASTVPGPSAPTGFTLHYITCDVVVFQVPDFSFPTAARISQNQRWYVSNIPVKAKDGTNWTEIFIASYQDGFIPTRCVGASWQASDGT